MLTIADNRPSNAPPSAAVPVSRGRQRICHADWEFSAKRFYYAVSRGEER
jgi:hypothetical protein